MILFGVNVGCNLQMNCTPFVRQYSLLFRNGVLLYVNMKQLGLVCRVRVKRKYNSYKDEVGKVAPNLLERHFKTNRLIRKGGHRCSCVQSKRPETLSISNPDWFNNEVIGYNLSPV